jgi:hypothetical protein
MAQSILYNFFALSSEAAVGFTGFAAAGAGESCGMRPAANVDPDAGAIPNRIAAERSRKYFNMADSLVADAGEAHLAAILDFWQRL